jgi:hypothetical protein
MERGGGEDGRLVRHDDTSEADDSVRLIVPHRMQSIDQAVYEDRKLGVGPG